MSRVNGKKKVKSEKKGRGTKGSRMSNSKKNNYKTPFHSSF